MKKNILFNFFKGNYLTPYDLACIRGQNTCAEYLSSHYGGQRGKLLCNIYIRRIQKHYRKYKKEKKDVITTRQGKIPFKSRSVSLHQIAPRHILLKQAKICLDNKKIDDHHKIQSLNINPQTTDENNAEDRRRMYAKSKTATSPMNESDESK